MLQRGPAVLRLPMRVLGQNLGAIAATLGAVGVIALGAIKIHAVHSNACDALLWTIQVDLFAARREERDAVERAAALTDPGAIRLNRDMLQDAVKSIEIFEERREQKKVECANWLW